MPPQRIGDHPAEGSALRYWSLRDVLSKLEHTRTQLAGQAVPITLYGVADDGNPVSLLDDIASILNRGGSQRLTPRADQSVPVTMVCGFTPLLHTLAHATARDTPPPQTEWIMQDEGSSGYGLTPYSSPDCIPAGGELIGLRLGTKGQEWEVAAVRWIDQTTEHSVKLGVEKLGERPRIVTLHPVEHLMSESLFTLSLPAAQTAPSQGILLPCERTLSSTLIVSDPEIGAGGFHDMRDGDYIYRIRITREQERSREWAHLEFDILTRRHVTSHSGR